MKKILALCLAMLMVLGLTAVLASCNGGKTGETGTKAQETPTKESQTATESKPEESKTEASSPEESKTEASTPEESKTEASTPEESKTEASTPEESKTEASTPEESKTEASTPEESKTEASTPEESKTEESKTETTTTDPGPVDPVDPVTGNFDTVLSHPWFNYNFADGKQYGFTDEDGLREMRVIDMHAAGLDCATLNGWTQVFVYYIPSRTASGSKFTTTDLLAFGAMRGVNNGSYTFGARFSVSGGRGLELSNALYQSKDADRDSDKLNFTNELSEKYVMFVQVFTTEKQSLWASGKKVYSCAPAYAGQARMGLATMSHKYMILNGSVAGGTLDENATDQYKVYGVRLMYATGYAYAADEKAIATFFDYYNRGEDLPEPSVKHELSFVDPEVSVSFDAKDDSPSNWGNVLAKKYFEFDFSADGGLRGIKYIDLQKGTNENGERYWQGKLAGTTLVGLYNIPDVKYSNKDFIGLMQYHDYTDGDYDGALQYNLGEGTVSSINPENFMNSVNSISKKFYVTGWTLFVQTYDGTTIKLWCNGELVFIGDATGTRVQKYILGDAGDGTEKDSYLKRMIINGYAALRTHADDAIDLYDKYTIKMDYAAMYALGANDNAAKEIYDKFAAKYELKAPTIEQ